MKINRREHEYERTKKMLIKPHRPAALNLNKVFAIANENRIKREEEGNKVQHGILFYFLS